MINESLLSLGKQLKIAGGCHNWLHEELENRKDLSEIEEEDIERIMNYQKKRIGHHERIESQMNYFSQDFSPQNDFFKEDEVNPLPETKSLFKIDDFDFDNEKTTTFQ